MLTLLLYAGLATPFEQIRKRNQLSINLKIEFEITYSYQTKIAKNRIIKRYEADKDFTLQ